jgi:hypothetical protein
MIAKPGSGDALFELATNYIRQCGSSDRWVMCSVPGEPDTGSELADKSRDEIMPWVWP